MGLHCWIVDFVVLDLSVISSIMVCNYVCANRVLAGLGIKVSGVRNRKTWVVKKNCAGPGKSPCTLVGPCLRCIVEKVLDHVANVLGITNCGIEKQINGTKPLVKV